MNTTAALILLAWFLVTSSAIAMVYVVRGFSRNEREHKATRREWIDGTKGDDE